MQDVHWLTERVDSHVVVSAPRELGAGDEVDDGEPRARLEPEPGEIQVHHRLAHRMRIEVRHDDDGVGHAAVVFGREVLRVHQNRLVVAPVHVEVAQLSQGGVRGPDEIESLQVGRQRSTGLLRFRPVARLVLVLLVVEVLFAARSRNVLIQFVARVDAPARAGGRRKGCPYAVGRRSAELQVLGENVRGIHE